MRNCNSILSSAHIYLRQGFAVFLLCCLVHLLPGQGTLIKNYSVSEGLPSKTVYCMETDENGFLWIGTNEGISRFDGTRFKNYDVDDGLRDNSVLRMKKDGKKRIWYSTENGAFGYIENGNFHHAWQNPALRNSGIHSFIYDLVSDSTGQVWFATEVDGIWVWNDTTLRQMYPEGYLFTALRYENGVLTALSDSRGSNYASTIMRIDVIDKCILSNTQFSWEENAKLNRPLQMQIITPSGLVTGRTHGGVLSIGSIRDGFESHVIRELDSLGGTLFVRQFGDDFYALYPRNGLVKFRLKPDFTLAGAPVRYLPGLTTSSILKDSVGNMWVGTLEQGLFYFLPESQIQIVPTNLNFPGSINVARPIGDSILVFTDKSGGLFKLKSTTPEKILSARLRMNGLQDILPLKKGILVSLLAGGLLYVPDLAAKAKPYNIDSIGFVMANRRGFSTQLGPLEWVRLDDAGTSFLQSPPIKSFQLMNDDTLLIGTSFGLFKMALLENGRFVQTTQQIRVGPSKRVLNTRFDAFRRTWVIYADGLYQYTNGHMEAQQELNRAYSDIKMMQVDAVSDKSLFITTSSMGIIHYFPESHTWVQYDQTNVLNGNAVRHMYRKGENNYLLATSGGIMIMQYDPQKAIPVFQKFENVSLAHAGKVKRLSQVKSTLYVQNDDYLFTVPFHEKTSTSRSFSIMLETINSVPLEQCKTTLNPGFNNLRFEFTGIDFPSGGQIEYSYRLRGSQSDTAWFMTSTNEVNYSSLSPGSYTFEVRARAFDGLRSLNTASYAFTILPPWYRTWVFRIAALLTSVLVFALVFYLRIRMVRRRNEMELRLLESEQKALRSQMNPHFIFNSLNSIQRFLVNNNANESIRYLTKFGRLIRSILDHSRESAIPISEELTSLRLYMELESLRTGNKFDSEIVVDEQLDELSDKLPPLLLQPYVENAIWHGIMAKEGRGKITISLVDMKHSIRCKIEDDGVGRARARELKGGAATSRKSLGMNITADRIALLNRDKRRAITVSITDLVKEDGTPCGTKVEMDIPKNF